MTQTPASGPLGPVTTPPRSAVPIRMAGSACCAPRGACVAAASSAAATMIAAEIARTGFILALLGASGLLHHLLVDHLDVEADPVAELADGVLRHPALV